jgi:hypothetical protein
MLELDDVFDRSSDDTAAACIRAAPFSHVAGDGGYVAGGDCEFVFFIFDVDVFFSFWDFFVTFW